MEIQTPEIKEVQAAKAVIVHGGRVLVLRESKQYVEGTNAGKYDFPGGRVHDGEDLKTALLREVKEECGLDVIVGDVLLTREWRPVVKGKNLKITGTFFHCATGDLQVTLSEDHDDYKWVDTKDGMDHDLISPNEEVLMLLK